MPPWGWWPLALFGLVGVDRLLAGRSGGSRLGRGTLVGAGWLFPATFWMLDFSLPGYFAAGIVFSVVVGLGAFITPPGRSRRLALPAALALVEYMRWSVPFGGVPLATLPMSQVASPLGAVARLGGGVLMTLCLVAAAMAVSALLARAWRAGFVALGAVAAVVLVTALVPRSNDGRQIAAALVQGGGPQNTRAVSSDAQAVFDRHLTASAAIRRPVDLILWPENVVTLQVPLAGSAEGDALSALARRYRATVVAGVVENIGASRFANYSAVWRPDGSPAGRYEKVQRVPFGEYVPLRPLVDALSGGVASRLVPRDAVAGNQPAVVDSDVGRLGVVISWEVFFERRARDAIGHGGEILLNPTNGSSYWLTIVQSQQIAASRLQALETDRWVLQAAPTGFSAVVDPDGKVLQRSGVSERTVLEQTVRLRQGLSPAVRWGPAPWLILAAVLLCVGWLVQRRRDGRRQAAEATEGAHPVRVHMADAPSGP
jgi:apolipoprotein N-acyltransferase